jgi:hypothetical protein
LDEQNDLILEQSLLNQETSVNASLMRMKFNEKNFENIMISLTNIKEEIQSLKQKKLPKKMIKMFKNFEIQFTIRIIFCLCYMQDQE